MNRDEWSERVAEICERHQDETMLVSVPTLHMLVMASVIIANNEEQPKEIKEQFLDIAGHTAAILSLAIPEFKEIYEFMMAFEDDHKEDTKAEEVEDFSELIQQIAQEMKRLGWDYQKSRKEILKRYSEDSLELITKDELKEFLTYLQSL